MATERGTVSANQTQGCMTMDTSVQTDEAILPFTDKAHPTALLTATSTQPKIISHVSYTPDDMIDESNELVHIAGMKDIRTIGADQIIERNWNLEMLLLSWTPNRAVYPITPEHAAHVKSFISPAFQNQGDVIFFCSNGKMVRCHSLFLNMVIPRFANELIQMRDNKSSYIPLPYIPVFVTGVDDQCIQKFLDLLVNGKGHMTGMEVAKLRKVLDVLNINSDLSICIAPREFDVDTYLKNGCKLSKSMQLELEQITAHSSTHSNQQVVQSVSTTRSSDTVSTVPTDIRSRKISAKGKPTRRRRYFSPGKRDAALKELSEGKTVAQIEVSLGIDQETIRRWRKLAKAQNRKNDDAKQVASDQTSAQHVNTVNDPGVVCGIQPVSTINLNLDNVNRIPYLSEFNMDRVLNGWDTLEPLLPNGPNMNKETEGPSGLCNENDPFGAEVPFPFSIPNTDH